MAPFCKCIYWVWQQPCLCPFQELQMELCIGSALLARPLSASSLSLRWGHIGFISSQLFFFFGPQMASSHFGFTPFISSSLRLRWIQHWFLPLCLVCFVKGSWFLSLFQAQYLFQLISAKNMFKCSPLVDAVTAGDGGGGVGPRWETENLLRPGQLVTHLPYSSLPLSHLIPGQLVSHLVHLFHNWYFRDNLLGKPISPFPVFHLLQVFTHLPFSSLPLSHLILQSPFPPPAILDFFPSWHWMF